MLHILALGLNRHESGLAHCGATMDAAQPREPPEFRFGRFRLDPLRRVLLDGGSPARLGSRAVDLLLVLVRHRDRVLGKDELFDQVWPGLVVEENNLQQHISALRKLLGPQAIVTVPGRGYQFAERIAEPAAPAPAPGVAPARDGPPPLPNPGPLFGRDADLAEVCTRLEAHTLVTLVGPGGIGKTRLAWAAARADAGRWSDGVWGVDLAVLDQGAMLPAAVAQALGIVLPRSGSTDDDLAVVAAALRRQRLLLLLDNCEHLLDAVATLVEALRRQAPQVHVLATSQEPLRLADEQVLRLAPLGEDAAVQLFVARAVAAERRFLPGDDERAAVADICRRLDGLPLAIELAAARVPLLGVAGLRQRLGDGLRVLAGGPARAPARQQTLRAALAWSHALLSAPEQTVFRRLAVFSGGCSLALAQQVLADADFEPWAVLDHLGALVDKSLLIADGAPGQEPRCRLLEPTRAHALDRLGAAGEAPALRLRHAQAMVGLLRSLDHDVVHEWRYDRLLRPLAAETDNLRAAMQWLGALGRGEVAEAPLDAAAVRQLAITLAAHADWLWVEADRYGDGLRFCAQAREWLDETVPPALACRLRLAWQGQARARAMPAATWIEDARLALAGYRALDDRVGLYRALCLLGGAPRSVITQAEAGALLAEAGELEDPAWSPRIRMRLQVSLEWWHDLGGRLEDCRDAGRRYLALAREAGSVRSEIGSLGNLADTEYALGEVDAAIALCRQAITLAAERGCPEEALHAYSNMVPALLARGEVQAAEDAIRTGRHLMVRTLGSAIELLLPAALLAWQRGETQRAATLLGCADHAYAENGDEPHPPERRMRDTVLAGLQAALPAEALALLRQQGAGWGEDEGFGQAGLG